MLRVSTIRASSAGTSAKYYTRYLTGAPGEVPGVWSGGQAAGLGLSGNGRHATTCRPCWRAVTRFRGHGSATPLVDRVTADGRVVKAVAGFDATFSSPKSVSVLWALTGDERFLEGPRRRRHGGVGPSGAVRVDDADPLQRRPAASGHARVDDGGVPPDDVAGR